MKPEGFRGRAYSGLVTPECYQCIVHHLINFWSFSEVILARDPRPSSAVFYDALKSGALSAGLKVYDCGVMPTPMVAKWQSDHGGIALVVTASHNPITDNGLKIIGNRLTKEQCEALSNGLLNQAPQPLEGECIDFQYVVKQHYIDQLKASGLAIEERVRIDHAHGSWSMHLDVLEALGLEVEVLERFNPNKINQSGCLHVDTIAKEDTEEGLIACFDGDGDRLNLVNEGWVLDGDDILYHLVEDKGAVGTLMTNQGLVEAFSQNGLKLVRVDVGDYHVASALHELGLRYGAEPCGHIIDIEWMNLSDPIYILLKWLNQNRHAKPIYKCPQRHIALPLTQDIQIIERIIHHPKVRYIIRYSETEPVIRVMLEGPRQLIDDLALQVTDQALNV